MPSPTPLPLAAADRFRQSVRDRLTGLDRAYARNGLRPIPYSLTPEARAIFTAWYGTRSGSQFEKRLDTYGHRLLVLLAAMDDRPEVDGEIATAVVDLLRYQLAVRRECDPIDADNTVARMEERLRRVLIRSPHSERDLKIAVHVERTGLWVFETAVENLKRADELAVDVATTVRGHPQRVYRLRSAPTSVPTLVGTDNLAP